MSPLSVTRSLDNSRARQKDGHKLYDEDLRPRSIPRRGFHIAPTTYGYTYVIYMPHHQSSYQKYIHVISKQPIEGCHAIGTWDCANEVSGKGGWIWWARAWMNHHTGGSAVDPESYWFNFPSPLKLKEVEPTRHESGNFSLGSQTWRNIERDRKVGYS